MLTQVRPALVLVVLLTLVTGLAYPLAMTSLAAFIFPKQAGGSLIETNGTIVGSSLIAQGFGSDRYFHPRPSATLAPDPKDAAKTIAAPYNAQNSAGSNLGPTNKALIDRIKGDVAKLKAENPGESIPQDLVTTSASGLDPDISPEAARFQIPRIVKARRMSESALRDLVTRSTKPPTFGLFGEPRINVLELNLALDALPKT